MRNGALGLIEVTGFLGIVAAADTAVKAADVNIINVEKIKGGLSTLEISGDVGAVKAAVLAAEAEVNQLGCLLSSHVIPRIDQSVLQMELGNSKNVEKKQPVSEIVEQETVVKKEISKKGQTTNKTTKVEALK